MIWPAATPGADSIMNQNVKIHASVDFCLEQPKKDQSPGHAANELNYRIENRTPFNLLPPS